MIPSNIDHTVQAKRIGQRIRWAREIAYPNRSEFARLVDVDPATIRKIEYGERLPSVLLVQLICHVLHISPQYVLWGRFDGVSNEMRVALQATHPELKKPCRPPVPGRRYKSDNPTVSGR